MTALPAAATGAPEVRTSPPQPMPGLPSGIGGPVRQDGPGDCIDCFACVNVCPMGIDIRDGQQMACITCGLCIDACDDVMEKIGKPAGLIGYIALKDEARERAGEPPTPVWRHILRPRTLLYTGLWSLVGVGLVVALFIRPAIDVTVAPVRNPTFVMLSDGSIRNTYDLRIRNKNGDERPFRIGIADADGLRVEVEGSGDGVVAVPADSLGIERVYVIAAPGSDPAAADRTGIRFWVEDLHSNERTAADTVFNGKAQ